MAKKKTILFVAMPDSIHTARWIEQLRDQGWDIHLFPSVLAPLHLRINNVTVHYLWQQKKVFGRGSSKKTIFKLFERVLYAVLRRLFPYLLLSLRAKQLTRLIQHIQPDIVHSLEMQSAGYLTLAAKNSLATTFPAWIMTTWGSDIFFFGKIPQHQDRIRQVLANCDYYSCECERDIKLAKQFGFNKTFLPAAPVTGGFDLIKLEKIRSQQFTSERRVIMLKGYQHWAGRALVGLQALAGCADILQGYTVVIYSAAKVVIKEAALLNQKTGIVIKIIPNGITNDEILALHAQAKLSIGLSITDGISVSLLEAMVMGAFPIQSCTACADEWIEHGLSGMIVPAEEPEIIAMWIRKALLDDELVNRAAQINWQTALARLDNTLLKQQAIDIYNSVELQ